MKVLFILLVACAVSHCVQPNLDEEWYQFKAKFNKIYKSPEEETYRYKIFSENLDKINKSKQLYESGNSTFWLAVTQYADMSSGELFGKQNLTYGFDSTQLYDYIYNPSLLTLQKSVDYKQLFYLNNPPKSQYRCASGWAFTAAEVLRIQRMIHYGGSIPDLSPQNLIDCSFTYGNQGCFNGWVPNAFNYIKQYGIYTEENYPYVGKVTACQSDGSKSYLSLKSIWKVYPDETVLQDAVTKMGPIAVSVDASEWHLYGGGIFRSSSRRVNHNHFAIICGYGSVNGIDYWLIRNSAGPTLGEEGYIRIPRHTNEFGIKDGAYFPQF